MNKIKEKIIELMKDKDKVHLKELYENLEVKKESIRSVINASVKKGDTFERLGKGYYKLL